MTRGTHHRSDTRTHLGTLTRTHADAAREHADSAMAIAQPVIIPPAKVPGPPDPPELPAETQRQLFDAYLHTPDPVPQIAERLHLTLTEFIRWHDHPRTRDILADLDRIALRRAEHQRTQAAPVATDSLAILATHHALKPETARKAAAAILHPPPRTAPHDHPGPKRDLGTNHPTKPILPTRPNRVLPHRRESPPTPDNPSLTPEAPVPRRSNPTRPPRLPPRSRYPSGAHGVPDSDQGVRTERPTTERQMTHTTAITALAALTLTAAPALAITVPYTEAFTSGNANWTNAANAPLDAFGTGGPDNSPYASTTFNFAGTNPQSTPAILRAQSTTNASAGNFFGDWITNNASFLTFDFRHDAGAPLDTFVRWTGAGSPPAPGLILLGPTVQPNTWTTISLPVSSLSPFFPEPGADFNAIFSQVVRMQFGVTPGALAGVNTTVRFDIDNVTITPTPAAAALLTPFAFTAFRRRR